MNTLQLTADTEIVVNLWYVTDSLGMINRLLGRAYIENGTDDDKLRRLARRAGRDFWIAKQFALPQQFWTFVGDAKQPVFPVAAYRTLARVSIFEEVLDALNADLPGFTPLKIPDSPLVCFTNLWIDDAGELQPQLKAQERF